MSSTTLSRLGGWAAMLAGVLRTVASFIPYAQPTAALEWLYLVIDVLLLLGLLGIYMHQHAQVGLLGFLGFLAALIGTASIIGPDGSIGGVDLYIVGSLLISFGLSVLGVAVWQAHTLPRAVPVLWWSSTVLGIGGVAVGGLPITFLFAGVAFGMAFILAGIRLGRRAS